MNPLDVINEAPMGCDWDGESAGAILDALCPPGQIRCIDRRPQPCPECNGGGASPADGPKKRICRTCGGRGTVDADRIRQLEEVAPPHVVQAIADNDMYTVTEWLRLDEPPLFRLVDVRRSCPADPCDLDAGHDGNHAYFEVGGVTVECKCHDDGLVLDQRDCPVHGCDCSDDHPWHDIDCPASVMRHFRVGDTEGSAPAFRVAAVPPKEDAK